MALLLPAADFSGIWLGSVTGGRRNQVQDFAFQFIQKGNDTLTGKLKLNRQQHARYSKAQSTEIALHFR